jgi:hypothetical protein
MARDDDGGEATLQVCECSGLQGLRQEPNLLVVLALAGDVPTRACFAQATISHASSTAMYRHRIPLNI